MSDDDAFGSVRYIVHDVQAAIDFYVEHLGFELLSHPAPPFADVVRGRLRLLLSGPGSSGGRATPAEQDVPGRNRIQVVVADLDEQQERLLAAGVTLSTAVVEGPAGRQFLVADPAGNLVEVFEPASG